MYRLIKKPNVKIQGLNVPKLTEQTVLVVIFKFKNFFVINTTYAKMRTTKYFRHTLYTSILAYAMEIQINFAEYFKQISAVRG